MKFVIAIMQDYDCDRLLRAVTAAGLGATRIASTGGFLRTGNTTVVMGVEDDRMDECLSILERSCKSRVEVQVDVDSPEYVEWFPAGVHEVTVGGAVVFVARVERFVRIPVAS
ncbi:MAG TPA: cyclic-di-AMP receptor [Thermomicrobiales bacterium]|nr:cyclic-di-AMP receptor [Thermomicrobiales bacterium]